MDGRDTDPGPAAAQVELLASTPPRFKENADDYRVQEEHGNGRAVEISDSVTQECVRQAVQGECNAPRASRRKQQPLCG
jgi:hypothetical protein